jgi:GMP synthase (glutamine-hydrolysing)
LNARVAFLRHSEWDLPGLLGEHSTELDFSVTTHRADHGPDALPSTADFDLLVVMGSSASTEFSPPPWVAPERVLLADAVEQGIPVLGVCFGGQLLAQVLGARVRRAPQPEIGWRRLSTDAPGLIPPGPWVSWHVDQFDAPPGADVVARTETGLQAYIAGIHTGLQFHPEVDAAIVGHWLDDDLPTGSVTAEQAAELRSGFELYGQAAAEQAVQLFDAFLNRAGIPG